MDFRKRMVLLFLLLSLVPFVLLQIETQAVYLPTITHRIEALFTYNLQQKSENLQRLVQERTNLFSQIENDGTLTESVRDVRATADPTAYQRSRLIDVFSRYSVNNPMISGIGFIRKDGLVVGYDRYLLKGDFFSFQAYGSVRQIMGRVDAEGSLVTFPTRTFQTGLGVPLNLLLTVFPYFDLTTNTQEGYLFLLINEATFQEVLNPVVPDQSGIVARSLVYDSGGRLISFPGPAALPLPADDPDDPRRNPQDLGPRIPVLAGRNLAWVSLPVPKTDWTLGTLYDRDSLLSDRAAINWYTFLLGLIFFLASGLVLWAVSRKLLTSLTRLVDQVKVADNRLDLGATPEPRSELDYLGRVFGQMRDHIQGLVTEVNERNDTLLQVADRQRLAEIRALEAQVNPHFLYNTLNTLNWIAIRHDQHDLSRGLADLAEILRYSISQIEVTAPLSDEVVWLRRYLDLQQLRFRNNFQYRIDTEGVDLGFRIYKLLFQPLVENALIHGFDPNTPGGLLEIRFRLGANRRLEALIRDNGRGFEAPAPGSAGPSGSIGLSNLEQRLEVYYRGEARLSWVSGPGLGTSVTLGVPEAGR